MNDKQHAIGAFVNSFIEFANSKEHMELKELFNLTTGSWLRDFRTISFTIPRQMGAAFWIDSNYLQDPNSILIVYNDDTRNAMQQSWSKDGKYHSLTVSDRTADWGLDSTFMNRIFTIGEIKKLVNQNKPITTIDVKNINKVYINLDGLVFSKISKNKFYDWLAEHLLDDAGLIITTYK